MKTNSFLFVLNLLLIPTFSTKIQKLYLDDPDKKDDAVFGSNTLITNTTDGDYRTSFRGRPAQDNDDKKMRLSFESLENFDIEIKVANVTIYTSQKTIVSEVELRTRDREAGLVTCRRWEPEFEAAVMIFDLDQNPSPNNVNFKDSLREQVFLCSANVTSTGIKVWFRDNDEIDVNEIEVFGTKTSRTTTSGTTTLKTIPLSTTTSKTTASNIFNETVATNPVEIDNTGLIFEALLESGAVIGQNILSNITIPFENILTAENIQELISEEKITFGEIVDLQENFEQLLKTTEPNLKFEIENLKITTTNIIQPTNSSFDNYLITDETTSIIVPVISGIYPANCTTPLAVARYRNARHLDPALKTDESLSITSFSITTCVENPDFSQNNIEIKMIIETNNSTRLISSNSVLCSYFDTDSASFKTDGVTTSFNEDTKEVTCKSDHLTYFAIIFKPDQKITNRALILSDKILTVVSTAILAATILILTKKSRNYSITNFICFTKILQKPRLRASFCISVCLFLYNLVFVFGQQFYWPETDNNCKIVAALQMFFINSLFFQLLVSACSLMMQLKMQMKVGSSSNIFLAMEFILPYFVSAVILSVSLIVDAVHSSFLRMVDFDNGMKLCFVDNSTFYFGVGAPFAVSMLFVVAAYLSAGHHLLMRQDKASDCSEIQAVKTNFKKMALVFISLGVGWSCLILVISGRVGIWADWLVTIFKFLQSISLAMSIK